MPIVSMRDDILNAEVVDYSQIVPGMFLNATIKSIITDDPTRAGVILNISKFVEGHFPLQHMGDMPLKTIPPKF